MSKVSVILPCYNVEKYLPRAIESVLKQTFSDFELLVVIDGSPDSSKAIAEEYAQIDGRIKVFEKKNGGLSDARNYGMERANGDYIYFMDSDDWIEPNLLKDNIRILEDESLDFVIFGYKQDDEDSNGQVVNSKVVSPGDNRFEKDIKNLRVDAKLLGLFGYAWNKVYRRAFLETHNFKFEKGTSLVEDILFNLDVYTKSDIIRTSAGCYYHYLNRPVATLIKKFHANSFELKNRRVKSLAAFFEEWPVENANELLGYCAVQGIKYCVHNMFAFENQFSFREKVDFINKMLTDKATEAYVPYHKTVAFKDSLYKWLIVNKKAGLLALLAKITK